MSAWSLRIGWLVARKARVGDAHLIRRTLNQSIRVQPASEKLFMYIFLPSIAWKLLHFVALCLIAETRQGCCHGRNQFHQLTFDLIECQRRGLLNKYVVQYLKWLISKYPKVIKSATRFKRMFKCSNSCFVCAEHLKGIVPFVKGWTRFRFNITTYHICP